MLAPEFMAYELRPGLTAGAAVNEILSKLSDLLRVAGRTGSGAPDEDDERFYQAQAEAARRRYRKEPEPRGREDATPASLEPVVVDAVSRVDIAALREGIEAAVKALGGAAEVRSRMERARRARLESELLILLLAEDDDE